jgi:hypothetical protein
MKKHPEFVKLLFLRVYKVIINDCLFPISHLSLLEAKYKKIIFLLINRYKLSESNNNENG